MSRTTIVLSGLELKKLIAVSAFVDFSNSAVALANVDGEMHAYGTDGQIAVDALVSPSSENLGRHIAFFGEDSIKEFKKITRLKKSDKLDFTLDLDHEGRTWGVGDHEGILEWHDLPEVDHFIGPNKVIYPVAGWYNARLLGLLSDINSTMGYLDEFWAIGSILDPEVTAKTLSEHDRDRPTKLFATRDGWRAFCVSNDSRRGLEVNGYRISRETFEKSLT